MLSSTTHTPRIKKTTGLRYWMSRVLEECDRVAADFSPDPVHDLRVALRRCRSLADGLHALDPDPNWKAMRKAGKRLFQRLGALRDIQIMRVSRSWSRTTSLPSYWCYRLLSVSTFATAGLFSRNFFP